MKIWNSYGTEHSYNLVMIGTFKEEYEAKKVMETIERLEEELSGMNVESNRDRYSEEVMKLLQEVNCMSLATHELEQFLYDRSMKIDGNKLTFSTDEIDISALIKVMIDSGAKVEIFEQQFNEENQD